MAKKNEKTLDNTSKETAAAVKDMQIHGDPDAWKCLAKASSKAEGWMKSTKAMEIKGKGVLVQVSTQQGDQVAEALAFLPGTKIREFKGNLEIVDVDWRDPTPA